MKVILKSKRLYLRELKLADLDELCRLDGDPNVMKYIGNGQPRSPEIVEHSLISAIGKYKTQPGLGKWAACLKDDDTIIGWATLCILDESEFIEIGYRLFQEYWGNGYASELSKTLLIYGFEKLKLDKIVGITHPQNAASQNVLLKTGLKENGKAKFYGVEVKFFQLNREEYQKMKG